MDEMLFEFLRVISEEAPKLCRNGCPSYLQHTSMECIKEFDCDVLAKELNTQAPLMTKVLECLVNKEQHENRSAFCFIASCVLFLRNAQMSRLQYMISFLLDQCHVINEVEQNISNLR